MKDTNPINNRTYKGLEVDSESLQQFYPDDVDVEILELLDHPAALKVKESGDCLFASISLLLCGTETLAAELRESVSKELVKNAEKYAHHKALGVSCGGKPFDRVFPLAFSMKSQHEEWEVNRDKVACVVHEGKYVAGTKVYGSFVAILALAELLKRPVYSVYPNIEYNFRPLFHQKIVPSCCLFTTPIIILWTSKRLDGCSKENFAPNHFVPVVDNSSIFFVDN